MWTGSISFGLVNIPVRLYAATRENRISFHQLHDQDHARLRRKLVCPADGKEVHPEHIVKGFEVGPDNFIVIRQDELESCAPEKTRAIEITDFVDITEIDPIYYDHPYYVLPQAGAGKSYRLLVEAMNRSKKVGIARIVFHDKEYLAALRPVGAGLCLETMYFGDEIVPSETIGELPAHKSAGNEKEIKAAHALIEKLTETFDPEKYHDSWKKSVKKMLEKKSEGVKPTVQEKAEKKPAGRAANLMAALEESLAHARSEAGGAKAKAPSKSKPTHARRPARQKEKV
jgi:DNA end-binding protein Ku